MEIRFSPQQKLLLAQAREKGFLTLNDFVMVYSHAPTRKSAIERFVQLGYLKESSTAGKFEYTGGKK